MRTALKIARGALLTLAALLILANGTLLVIKAATHKKQPTLFGWSWAVVMSGSMEPTIRVGDLVVFRERGSYEAGDVITFEDDSVSRAVTHRIVEKLPSGYRTRGDGNNAADTKLVAPEKVIGKVVCTIPRIGRFIGFLRTPLGFLLLCAAVLLLAEGPILSERLRKRER